MRPELVERGIREREGDCRRCGTCCHFVYRCPFLLDNTCLIYEKRPKQCREFPVLSQDLRGLENVCGYCVVKASRLRHPNRLCRLLGIAHYGIREVVASGVLFGAAGGILLAFAPKFALLPLLGFCAVLYFFRDPERRIPEGEENILAPADGRVKDIDEIEENDFLGGSATRIGIALSILNVHVNRAPCSGEVEFLKYTPGKFHNAFGKKASLENENNLIGIGNRLVDGGIAVRQIAGAVARRIVCDCELEDKVERGQRIGMIKFGSRTEIYIPSGADFELLVKPGQRVKAGLTVIGIVRCER
jgi:phosphatidylserine decarboxylase